MRQRRLNFSPNIDIRGMRGDEAMQQVEQFLDDAQMFNIPFVSILHGKGTGILRQLLHDYLRHATFVESFTNTSPTCGDGGITEVYLKG
jgi:mutS2 family protein